MDRKTLYGVVCASICPMNEDGSVDYASVRTLTRHLVDHGIHCLYPNGTNGESLSLTEDERRQVARIIAEENAGKAVLYIQCGAATVEESYRARSVQPRNRRGRRGIDDAGILCNG